MREHHQHYLWVWWTIIALGVWLILSPLTFSPWVGQVAPAGGRQLYLSPDARAMAMLLSDLISGGLLVLLGLACLTPGRFILQWLACFVGVWLQFAPLIFWAPTAAGYLNDTLVGALVIALTILIPSMPAMMLIMKPGPHIPPGWSYNPSAWPQRWILIALALAGWLVSRYLAGYEMGYIRHVWEPFFGDGTRQVLESKVSRMLPIPDAALGACAYTFEFLMGWMGGTARWRSMPWMVLFFGILIVPLGLVHILLVASQPLVVGHWCTLCLLAAAIMLPMIPLMLDEVVAMIQFMHQAVVRNHRPFWTTFWKGGTLDGGTKDGRSPELLDFAAKPGRIVRAATWGMTLPWTLALIILSGLWLMFAPAVMGTAHAAADSDHLFGALLIVVSVIALAEVVRPIRWLNLPIGVWLLIAPWVLNGMNAGAIISDLIVAVLILLLSLPRGPVREHYGNWDRWIRWGL